MRTCKMCLEIFRSTFRHQVHWNTRGVGGDQRPWLSVFFNFFKQAIEEKRDAYLGLKDTVISGYDGVMREIVETIYKDQYQAEFEKLGLKYFYERVLLVFFLGVRGNRGKHQN